MDPEVEALARALRLDEARELCLVRGDGVRALELAIESRRPESVRAVARGLPAALRARGRAAAIRMRDPFAEACVAEAAGDVDDAITLFERAEAWVDVARVHGGRGDVGKAGRALERHLEREPGDATSRKTLADLLLSVGRADACLRTLRGLDDDDAGRLRRRAHEALGLGEGRAAAPVVPDGQLLFGRYEVVREVASTPSSRVLEALDRLDPERARVALKIFTGTGHAGAGRDALARFRREVDALGRLDTASVLKPRAYLPDGPTLVLPWASGGSVANLLDRGIPTPRRSAEIVERVLEALAAAHRRGILHRDVKPANVLLDEAGGAFLADFGVAHLGDESATATAGVIGTVRYMSPEQRRGEPATARSDLYAVGVLLADLLGVPLEPERRRGLPTDVAALLSDLLAEDERARPADADAVRARVRAISWPERALGEARCPSLPSPNDVADARFESTPWGVRDRLLERDELRIAPSDPRYGVARALAVSAHPALPAVLGAEGDVLRVEAIAGPGAGRLTDEERAHLAEARELLRQAGLARDAFAARLVRTPRGVVMGIELSGGADDDAPAADPATPEAVGQRSGSATA
jgi:hypothetical protein